MREKKRARLLIGELSVLSLNLTRSDSRMKVRLMVLPDKLSGGACENIDSE